MIRQICPHCFESVELPDDAAGTAAACPKCEKSFPVPGRYTPAVDPGLGVTLAPAPPPGFVPPGVGGPTTATATSGVAGDAGPAARRGGVTLNPLVLDWFPAGCFTAVLVLSVFPWVGLYPGGHDAYTQSPWRAAVGGFGTDSFAEDVMKLQAQLRAAVRSNWVMLVYLAGLLFAVALAWADRLAAADGPAALHPRLGFAGAVWPHRYPLLAGLAVGLLALLLIQLTAGFGLENAVRRTVAAQFADAAAAADGNAAATQKLVIQQGMELGKYHVETTTALSLAVGTHATLVAATGLRLWLYRRGAKPPPRVGWEG